MLIYRRWVGYQRMYKFKRVTRERPHCIQKKIRIMLFRRNSWHIVIRNSNYCKVDGPNKAVFKQLTVRKMDEPDPMKYVLSFACCGKSAVHLILLYTFSKIMFQVSNSLNYFSSRENWMLLAGNSSGQQEAQNNTYWINAGVIIIISFLLQYQMMTILLFLCCIQYLLVPRLCAYSCIIWWCVCRFFHTERLLNG